MSADLAAPPTLPPGQPEPDADPFRYGWRFVPKTNPDGKVELEQIPLSLEDVLHPQEGDVIPERPLQEQERGYLASVFRTRLERLTGGLVLSDCLVDWGVPGIGNHSPDVSLFEGLVEEPDPERGLFHLAPSGGRCVLAIELVSPDTRVNDVEKKFDHYFQVRVPLYIIVDQLHEGDPRHILAYRHTRSKYVPVPADGEGRILLRPLGLLLGLRENRVICYDAQTGKEVGDYTEVTLALEDAEQRAWKEGRARVEAEQRAREAEQRAREAEQRAREAERRGREEAKAREEAQGQAREETRAREEAQRQAREETRAREAAERQARQAERQAREETKARIAAEQRIQEIEAELRQFREKS